MKPQHSIAKRADIIAHHAGKSPLFSPVAATISICLGVLFYVTGLPFLIVFIAAHFVVFVLVQSFEPKHPAFDSLSRRQIDAAHASVRKKTIIAPVPVTEAQRWWETIVATYSIHQFRQFGLDLRPSFGRIDVRASNGKIMTVPVGSMYIRAEDVRDVLRHIDRYPVSVDVSGQGHLAVIVTMCLCNAASITPSDHLLRDLLSSAAEPLGTARRRAPSPDLSRAFGGRAPSASPSGSAERRASSPDLSRAFGGRAPSASPSGSAERRASSPDLSRAFGGRAPSASPTEAANDEAPSPALSRAFGGRAPSASPTEAANDEAPSPALSRAFGGRAPSASPTEAANDEAPSPALSRAFGGRAPSASPTEAANDEAPSPALSRAFGGRAPSASPTEAAEMRGAGTEGSDMVSESDELEWGRAFETPPWDILSDAWLDHIAPPMREIAAKTVRSGHSSSYTVADIQRWGDKTARTIEGILSAFGVQVDVRLARFGPSLADFAVSLPQGLPVTKVIERQRDLQTRLGLNLCVLQDEETRHIMVRVPLARSFPIGMRHIFMHARRDGLTCFAGIGMDGRPVHLDIARAPHILVGGTTGSGKSNWMHVMLASLIASRAPGAVQLVLIDLKAGAEFRRYARLPHLSPLVPPRRTMRVVEDHAHASMTLQRIAVEMALRHRQQEQTANFPPIVVIIDEFESLFDRRDAEDALIKLASQGRSVGVHLIAATQRPSADVIQGRIRANFPVRVAFQTASAVDSKVILGVAGAEQLHRSGDMLVSVNNRKVRLQSPLVDASLIDDMVDQWQRWSDSEAMLRSYAVGAFLPPLDRAQGCIVGRRPKFLRDVVDGMLIEHLHDRFTRVVVIGDRPNGGDLSLPDVGVFSPDPQSLLRGLAYARQTASPVIVRDVSLDQTVQSERGTFTLDAIVRSFAGRTVIYVMTDEND
jgi:hypothetical protein